MKTQGEDASEAVLTWGRTLTAAIMLADEDRTLTVESCGGQGCYVLIEESYEQKHPPVDPISTETDDLFGAFNADSNSEKTKHFILLAFRYYTNFIFTFPPKTIKVLLCQMRPRL